MNDLLGATTLSRTTVNIMTFSIRPLSIMAFGIIKLNIMILITFSITINST